MKNQAPFLNISSFAVEEVTQEIFETSTPPSTPFLSLYESEETGGVIDPETEEYVQFLNELYDEEFDEALYGLVSEAASLYEVRFTHENGDSRIIGYEAERFLNQHFAPLITESEAMLGSLETELSQRDIKSLSEYEIGEIVDRYKPSIELTPNFENFLGRLKKAVKKVAGKAVDLAKKGISAAAKLGIGPILNKLKALIKPLLKRVVQTAIGKLPVQLQPMAKKLAERLPFLKEFEEGNYPVPEDTELSEISLIQYEFDQHVANVLFAHTEVEQDLEVSQVLTEQQIPDVYPLAELDNARNDFVEKLQHLKEGEDPTPYVENFIPAILPALKVGIRLIGRKKVVDFLAKFLGKLIQKFVGPQHTPALSQAIVDAGLRLIHLEATYEDESRAASSAVAATIEETVRRVAELPDYILNDQELLEGFVLEAFEQAAATNLPQVLPEEIYQKRPDLGEARKLRSTWITMPSGRRKRYKKFSRKIPTRLSPHKVSAIKTFEGISLEEFLEEKLGVAPGEEVEAIVHLYESIPGTRLTDISRLEENSTGLNTQDAYEQLHPLTADAAGLLLGEPELGRDVDPRYLIDPYSTTVGQRFYYLEIPGKRPLMTPVAPGQAKMRRATSVRVILDFPRNEIEVRLFLSEIRAQEIAVKLRQHTHIGTVTARLQKPIKRGLRRALSGSPGRLKIIHEAVTPDQWSSAFQRLPSLVPMILLGKLNEWVLKGISDHLKQHSEAFIQAASDTADGVTLVVTVENPPGFPQLRQALKGESLSLPSLKMSDGTPTVKIRVTPGYSHE
ncbi:MAG: hypothetical protein ACOX7X_09700 [Methanosarcina flavescens]|jgi:hypothetical protein|uniref:Uncharacterized protein n=1 Tax=Methanosarcina flavescens TaxID=1715806 RepID=A0A660HPI5_9EURY|nr:hypothetical protein [Methanosarcina flavescens]AYK14180.1 hypothetical protein AOB57_002320 [Methanosarcina flavescens]NLK33164.1 hypothetical protein [Methanosarcina flavescens]